MKLKIRSQRSSAEKQTSDAGVPPQLPSSQLTIDVITNDYDEFLEDKLKRCNERRGKSRMVMCIEMNRFSTISYQMSKVKPIQESMRE